MELKEKLSNATDEQIERYWHSLYFFNCDGIKCKECLFRTQDHICLSLAVEAEKISRKAAE